MDIFETTRDDSNTPPGETAPSLVAKIKDHARRHYNEGWDFIVECYSDADIAAECKDKNWTTLAQWTKFYSDIVEIRNDRLPVEGWDY